MRTLRTPDDCFADLPGYAFEPCYAEIPAENSDGDGGTLRVHYVDEGKTLRPFSSCTANRRGAICTGT